MAEKKEIIGYYTDDGNIYCVDCILKTQEEIRKEIEKAITVEDTEEELYFCDGCKSCRLLCKKATLGVLKVDP
jgi:MinD superfamily P-loop ATPase